jgi:hydroxypyruvate reductase
MPMAVAAVSVAVDNELAIAGGLIVAPAAAASPHPALPVAVGDHPEPGPGSLAAAAQLGALAERVDADDHVWVLLSGGTTSLIGAPLEGIPPKDLRDLYSILLGSGLDISVMNRVRKRFTRWGGGKLAAALGGASVRQFIVSDVIGDDLPSIGSGPCVPDPATVSEVRRSLEQAGLWKRLPAAVQAHAQHTERGTRPETPKPDHPAFASVLTEIVSSNRRAVEAASLRAAGLGLIVEADPTPLDGEASQAGISVAATLRNYSQARQTQDPTRRCVIWGGETTVTLGDHPGLGGRSQELALSAACVLVGSEGVSLLAGGTDGRDGPTDAAGAIVDGQTWTEIQAAGRDPAKDLDSHDAYHALAAAGALLQPGLTGTNVMDVVFGVA